MTRLRGGIAAISKKLKGEAGQGLAEYALILTLIAIVCVGALSSLGVAISESEGFVTLPAAL